MHKVSVTIFLSVAIGGVLIAADITQNCNNNVEEQMQKPEPNNKAIDANNISITVVYDNNPYKEGLETSWGFSCVIKGTKETVLFDTGGDGRLLLENMSKTAIDVNSIETVILSHIHGDHTGGLEMFLKKNPKVNVYLPKSFPKRFKEKVTSLGAKAVEVDKQTKICTGICSTGQMGTLIKEQGLILKMPKGLVIITGCAHPGIVKMVKTAKDLFDEPVLLVMGGFHLEWATRDKIKSIISAFEDMNVKYVAPCHCTGKKARALFAEHFGDCYINTGIGKVIKIEDLN
jgi:7,8-dihydropterin-6-yl-methyl-4-(beta-D-ribofuranosyl)aminobenzene 5'-phosphate synthase